MKKLLPLGRVRSPGSIRGWTALIAAASMSWVPFSVALADQIQNNQHKSGDNKPASQHQSVQRGGGISKTPSQHQGGLGGDRVHKTINTHQSWSRSAEVARTTSTHQNRSSGREVKTAGTHQVRSHVTEVNKAAGTHQGSTRAIRSKSSLALKNSSSNSHTSLYTKSNSSTRVASEHRNGGTVNRLTTTSRTLAQTNKAGSRTRTNVPGTNHRMAAFDHSLTAASAHSLMSRRLTEITNRQWTGRGAVFSTRFDPERRCWFQHGGVWWRCNFWGAYTYCDHLIGLGRPAGLCWAWYDDICWGNIVVGMPLELVTYYYPTPVYTNYTQYDGYDATVYYYATDDGQFKEVTVVSGDVVDVEIVDQIG